MSVDSQSISILKTDNSKFLKRVASTKARMIKKTLRIIDLLVHSTKN